MALVNIIYSAEDIFFSDEFEGDRIIEFHRDLPILTEFCRKSRIALSKVDVTNEQGYTQNMYFFGDDLGGYTIDALAGII